MPNVSHGESGNAHDDKLALSYQGAEAGEIARFGRYLQAADGADRTPIRWRVLQRSSTGLFLLCESLLDCKRYHGAFVETTWRDCDLRKWLNGAFYEVAFSDAEKECIEITRCTGNGAGMPDTDDRIFLLGAAEVRALTGKHGVESGLVMRRAVGTEFAKVKKVDGCRLYVYDKSVSDGYLVENGQKQGCSWWWLRTQLGSASRATFVGPRASVRGYGRVNLGYYGVRPALQLHLP